MATQSVGLNCMRAFDSSDKNKSTFLYTKIDALFLLDTKCQL